MVTESKKGFRNSPDREKKVMEGVGIWTSYYRQSPSQLCIDYFGMTWMTWIQRILVDIMVLWTYIMWLASRGFGKSQVSAAALCAKAVLFPGEQIVIAAGVRSQSLNVLSKIVEQFMPASQNLSFEIDSYKITPQDAYISFKNGSMIKVVTASDSARSARANTILVDECALVKRTVVDSVLRKFKAGERMPGFFQKMKYKNYPKEPNAEIYITSATYQMNWTYERFKSFFKQMAKGSDYVVAGFPWQLPVYQGYYPLTQVLDEMSEGDFDAVKWSMEMDTLFYGQSSTAFYSYGDLDANRVVEYPMYPPSYFQVIQDSKFKYVPKQNGEIRIIGMDIAAMGGNSNDNTAYSMLSLMPNASSRYTRTLGYMEVLNGGNVSDQAIRLKQLFSDFDADYAVIDTNGVGLGVFDALVREQIDKDRGCTYDAWTCINDPKMAERCTAPHPKAVVYSVKASSQFNSDCAITLRDCIRQGRLKLLIQETDANEILMSSRAYNKLPIEDQVMFQMPYYNTTMFINETINLSYDIVNGKVRVSEPSGMRKDRYSSVSYANYFASELERDLLRPSYKDDVLGIFEFKRPSRR